MTRSNLEHEKPQFGPALSKTYGRLQQHGTRLWVPVPH
jgi:hypothetical protein